MPGYPHVSFSAGGGNSGGVSFGKGSSLLTKKNWSTRDSGGRSSHASSDAASAKRIASLQALAQETARVNQQTAMIQDTQARLQQLQARTEFERQLEQQMDRGGSSPRPATTAANSEQKG